jgi:protein HOOK3
MAESLRTEADAFFEFLATFKLSRPVTTIADLSDGAALFDVLSLVYVRFPMFLITVVSTLIPL